jgi:aerobic-type carbon monoxide dehydrogenase small subunit (CoxS/CutS family)
MIADGRTVYSCPRRDQVQGKQIRTVDGLSRGRSGASVQQAFVDRTR